MAQGNRTKEIWLVPKRCNLHQTICLIDGIIERNYNNTSWNPQKQNNLGVNLKRWGATKDGRNISQQAIRTLVASLPQYLGFLYINTNTTPNTICLTEAGMSLWHKHKDELVEIPNLVEGKELLINESEIVLRQMEKLQITNPVIKKDCENIYVFPFRFMLKVLLKVGYLDQEEIAFFLFKVRSEDEVDLIVEEINNFRKLSKVKRKQLIESFKKTHIGNITLVQASSAGYFLSLCTITGIIKKYRVDAKNRDGSIAGLSIKDEYIDYVDELVNKKYEYIEPYDFEDNLQLWIDYIGDPEKDFPPIDVSIVNTINERFFVQVFKDDYCVFEDVIQEKGIVQVPMFVDDEYSVTIIDVNDGKKLLSTIFAPSINEKEFAIEGIDGSVEEEESIEDLAEEIVEHCESSNFSKKTMNYLNVLNKLVGIDKTSDKNLRGGYFEYLVYKLLLKLKEENVIDDVIWNGKIGKYGLPVPAPGGFTGTPDITFMIDDLHIVLELTTIKAKAAQYQSEGASVPDHIGLYKERSGSKVVGVFCAPQIHNRNTAAMQSNLDRYGVKLNCINEKELIELLLSKDRETIKSLDE